MNSWIDRHALDYVPVSKRVVNLITELTSWDLALANLDAPRLLLAASKSVASPHVSVLVERIYLDKHSSAAPFHDKV